MKSLEHFYIKSPLAKLTSTIDQDNRIILLGSCFAESVGKYFDKYLFSQITNPFGTLYDTHSLALNIERAAQKRPDRKSICERIFCRDEVFYSHDLHSDIAEKSQEALEEKMLALYQNVHTHIAQSEWMIVSLGTSIVQIFEHTFPVANCHKLPKKHFTTHHQSVDEIVQHLKSLIHHTRKINPHIRFIFTVSPIRHLAVGMVENSRSKARLQVAIEQVIANSEFQDSVFYFPAFELMMDELRDYRFYARDYLHPSEEAIEYVWSRFVACCFSENAMNYLEEIEPIIQASLHRIRFPETSTSKKFLASFYEKIKSLQQKYPRKNWDNLLLHFSKSK